MADNFNEAGVPAAFLSSLSGDLDRFKTVNKFKFNEIKVLLNVDLFDEGFDVPVVEGKKIVETVILARPTMSLAKCLQQVGRALRPSPNKPHALIIDHVGNIKRHGLPCADRKWTLNDIERKKKPSTIRTCGECLSVYDRVLTACPYCGAEPKAASNSDGRVPPAFVDGDLVLIDPQTLSEMEAKTILESPDSVAQRVSHAAGLPAAKRAYKNQEKRINTQQVLRDVIAAWAGRQKELGLDDSEIHKQFYLDFNKTINEALAEPTAQMEESIELISEK
jgi:superfamily II DNA or RNA helicase